MRNKPCKTAISLLLTLSLVFVLLLPDLPASAVETAGSCQFKFSHLVTVDDIDTLIFTYLNDNYSSIHLELIPEGETEGESVLLTAGNTSAEFDDVIIGRSYTYTIEVDENESYSGFLTMTEDGVDYTDYSSIPFAAGQTFRCICCDEFFHNSIQNGEFLYVLQVSI